MRSIYFSELSTIEGILERAHSSLAKEQPIRRVRCYFFFLLHAAGMTFTPESALHPIFTVLLVFIVYKLYLFCPRALNNKLLMLIIHTHMHIKKHILW